MNEKIRIMEVGPRDGLQNQSRPLPIAIRKKYIQLLIDAGVEQLEAGSLVRADLVPQMAQSEDVLKGIDLKEVEAYFLVPNEQGLERALKATLKHLSVFTACTNGFNKKNIGKTMEQSRKEIKKLVLKAKGLGFKVRGYLSVVWGCPYDGRPKESDVLQMVESLLDAGCFEVTLGDTIGVATPKSVLKLLKIMAQKFSMEKLAVHFHDTRGLGIANTYAALGEGIRAVDASSGGLGGCPFAPGATGNVGTEDVLYLVDSLGYQCAINLEKLTKASVFIYEQLGIAHYVSKTLQAYLAKKWQSGSNCH